MIVILFTLLVVFGVGATFFGLANNYGKSAFLYIVLAVVVFFVSVVLFDVILMSIFNIEIAVIIFASYPVGILACWLLFSRLKKSWAKEAPVRSTNALDDGVTSEEQQ